MSLYSASKILGQDFILAEEIAKARHLSYTNEAIAQLNETVPDEAALLWCCDNKMLLLPGPPTAMSLIDVRALNADYFYSKGKALDDSGWYDDADEKFARNDKVEALCWIALRKEPVEDSLNKTWPDQQALVAEPMMVPNAAETVWALTTYKAVRDIYLLEDLYVRTSSLDSDGLRVYVGDFDDGGLDVRDYWDDYRLSFLGVSASRKF